MIVEESLRDSASMLLLLLSTISLRSPMKLGSDALAYVEITDAPL